MRTNGARVQTIFRHCERSEAIHLAEKVSESGLLRCARNDVETDSDEVQRFYNAAPQSRGTHVDTGKVDQLVGRGL